MNPPPEFVPRCLDWVEAHLDWFEPPTWDAHFPPREIPTQTVLELLLLCRVLERTSHAEDRRPLIERAHAIAVAGMADPGFAAGLRRLDDQFPYLVWVLALADDEGELCTALRHQVQRTIDLYELAVTSLDWPVVNFVELRYILDLGGFESDLPTFAELRGEQPYGEVDPMRLTENEVYSITHELLYAAQFGERTLSLTATGRDQLLDLLRTTLGIQIAEGQLDASAELLHCLLVAGGRTDDGTSSPHRESAGAVLSRVGWERLLASQLRSGGVPGPPYDPEVAATQVGEGATAYEFRTCYHTVLVAAMAAAATEAGLSAAPPAARDAEPTTRRPPIGARLQAAAADALARAGAHRPGRAGADRHPTAPDEPLTPERAITADLDVLTTVADFVPRHPDDSPGWLEVLPSAVAVAGRAGDIDTMVGLTRALLAAQRQRPERGPSPVIGAALRRLLVEQQADGGFGAVADTANLSTVLGALATAGHDDS